MKKLLLTGAALLALNLTVSAQQQLITSFEETETAGFVAGEDIGNYTDDWSTYSTANTGDVDSGLITISDEWASEGTQSLKFSAVSVGDDQANYAYGPLYNFTTLLGNTFSLTFDAYTNVLDESSSNMIYQYVNYDDTAQTQTAVAKVQFDYSGVIYVWDSSVAQTAANQYGYVDSGFTFDAETTYTINVRFNEDGSVTYLVNGEEAYTFTPTDSTVLNGYYYSAILTDDYGSDWYLDNFTVDVPTAGVANPALSQFAVYPNPATNFVTVSNENALVNSVAIIDMNGRAVKTVKFDGVAQAQVNISELSAGIYLMNISSDKGTTTKKIVKN